MESQQITKILELSKKCVKKSKMGKWLDYVAWSFKHGLNGYEIMAALDIMNMIISSSCRAEIAKGIDDVASKYIGFEGESGHQDDMRIKFIKHVYRDFVIDFIKQKRRTAIICWVKYLQGYTDGAKEHYYDNDPDLFKI